MNKSKLLFGDPISSYNAAMELNEVIFNPQDILICLLISQMYVMLNDIISSLDNLNDTLALIKDNILNIVEDNTS